MLADEVTEQMANVRYWHLADISIMPANVRFRGRRKADRHVVVFVLTSGRRLSATLREGPLKSTRND